MTREDAEYLHNQFEGHSLCYIRNVVNEELTNPTHHYCPGILYALGDFSNKENPKTSINLELICKEYIRKNSSTIKEILQKHPNYTNYVIDIIMLLAPAIAQQYFGISAMAIVGSITIICKQGIHSYLH